MKTIDTEQLTEMRQNDRHLTLINVLDREAFREEHIPGSHNVPLKNDDFLEQVEGLAGGKDQRVVVYCADEECTASSTAAKKLSSSGFEQVLDYEGGMKAWLESSQPVGRS